MVMSAADVEECSTEEGSESESDKEESCRICKVTSQEPLISPCYCKGSLAFVHVSCLQLWLQTTNRTSCEICQFHFETFLTRRYSLFQAIRLWLRNPLRRRQFKADVCNICLLSTVLTLIILICLVRLDAAAEQGAKNGISKFWTHSIMGFFLTLIIITYFWSIVYLIRKQISPFVRWWKSTHNIFLNLHDNPASHSAPSEVIAYPIQIVIR